MAGHIHVVAGVIPDGRGRYLLAQRLPGTHMAGAWEFPGGKLEQGEQPRDGLARELREELGVEVTLCTPLIRYTHSYPERRVTLDVWRVDGLRGEPDGLEGQALQWLRPREMLAAGLLPADLPVVTALGLPPVYAITPPGLKEPAALAAAVTRAVAAGTQLIQLRVPGISDEHLHTLAVAAVQSAGSASVMINAEPHYAISLALACGAAGIHVPSRFLDRLAGASLPDGLAVAASCHDAAELSLAQGIGADFAVLGPVRPTTSHPGASGTGWQRFRELTDGVALPVYAIGGMRPEESAVARSHGGQGTAGIGAFWAD